MTEFAPASALMIACLLLGVALVPLEWAGGCMLWLLAARLGSGLLALAGISGTYFSGRICYASLIPMIQIGAVMIWRWKANRVEAPIQQENWRTFAFLVAIAWFACLIGVHWQFEWRMPDGGIRNFHSDLGYHAQLAMGLPEAKASSHWAATLGSAAVDGSATRDVWYHWAPIWLAAGVSRVLAVPEWESLYQVIGPVFVFVLLLLAAAISKSVVAGLGTGAAFVVGAASLISVQWIRMFGVLWLGPVLPFGTVQHTRLSLAGHFPYQLEGIVIFMILAAWLRDQKGLAALLVFVAGVSSPHNVAVLGVSAGTLLGWGILCQRPSLWKPALAMISLLLGAWGTLHWGFGADLPKAADQSIFQWDWRVLLTRLRAGVMDAGIGLLFHILLLPGLIFLVWKKEGKRSLLGWLALSAWLGSYMAFHLLRHVSDGFHFTMLAHAALVMPVSLWGLMAAFREGSRGWRWLGLALVVICTAMGLHDLWHARERLTAMPYLGKDLRALRVSLKGRAVGYFAKTDRQWWISKHSTLASLLGVRCVRLNSLSSMDGDPYSRYYGASRPLELVPAREGESSADWSLRFAQRLGIRLILETDADPLPESIKTGAKVLHAGSTLRLYELPDTKPTSL